MNGNKDASSLRKITMNSKPGFTLIELLVVIAIIGLLSSVVLSSLNSARERAKNASTVAQVLQYEKALNLYYSNTGAYPGSTSWACVGTGYPGGVCWSSSSYTETSSASVNFRNALSSLIDTSVIPGPSTRTFGTMYQTISTGDFNILYTLEGDVSCPIGTKNSGSSYSNAGVTRCNYYGRGL